MLSGKPLALFVLAWAFVRTVFRRSRGVPKGLPVFQANYTADRLPPMGPDDRQLLAEVSRCIGCGRCDDDDGERRAAGGRYPGVMQFVLAGSRSMPDFDMAVRTIAPLSDAVLEAKEARCPENVPLRRLAQFVRGKAGRGLSLLPRS